MKSVIEEVINQQNTKQARELTYAGTHIIKIAPSHSK